MIIILVFCASALESIAFLERDWVIDPQSALDYIDPDASFHEVNRKVVLDSVTGKRLIIRDGSLTFIESDSRSIGPYTYSVRSGGESSFEIVIDEPSQEGLFSVVSLSEGRLCLQIDLAASNDSHRETIMVECYVPSDA